MKILNDDILEGKNREDNSHVTMMRRKSVERHLDNVPQHQHDIMENYPNYPWMNYPYRPDPTTGISKWPVSAPLVSPDIVVVGTCCVAVFSFVLVTRQNNKQQEILPATIKPIHPGSRNARGSDSMQARPLCHARSKYSRGSLRWR
jgi:hypothetical protein